MAKVDGKPQVGIVMGSDSDMPVMAKAADILEELGIPYEMKIISAHSAHIKTFADTINKEGD